MKFDIIIQGGQSNAEGCGVGPVRNELLPSMSENIFYLDAEKQAEHLPECVKITYADKPFIIRPAGERESDQGPIGDFSLAFGSMYEKELMQNSERKLLIVRAAVGGTGFVKGAWGLGNQLYLKMLEMTDYALSLNSENRMFSSSNCQICFMMFGQDMVRTFLLLWEILSTNGRVNT